MTNKKKTIRYVFFGLAFFLCFYAGMQTQKFIYKNIRLDMGGAINSRGICVIEEKAGKENSSDPKHEFIFISNDSTFRFRAIYRKQTESMLLEDETHERAYILKHVRTASGAKYEDIDGNFFWSKGTEFMWGKGDEIIARGKLAE